MKRTIILSLLMSFMIFGYINCIRAEVPQAKIDALYASLNGDFPPTDMGDSMMFIETDFNKSIPSQNQADVITILIDRAAKDPNGSKVMFNAMHLIEMAPLRNANLWNKRLKSILLAQVNNANFNIRSRLASIFLARPDMDQRDLILPLIYSLLQGDDDHYKEGLLDDVIKSKWPESKKICEDYIKATPWNEKNKQSLVVAKVFTNPEDAQRAGRLLGKQERPHVLKDYIAYIAAHKDDPDYAVSVNVAEQSIKSLQEEWNFYKSKAEYKKAEDIVKSNPAIVAKYGAVKGVELDDWGNNWGINGEMTYGEYGYFQFKLKGTSLDGIVRASWHYQNYRFEVTKIEEITSNDSVVSFWTYAAK